MQTQIVIFLAFVSATLIVNALIILFTYKAFAGMTTKVTDTVREFRATRSRAVLETLASASSRAVVLTGSIKERITSSEPGLARAQSTWGYHLAKVDVRFERLCDYLHREAKSAQAAVLGPTRKFGAVTSGIREVLVLIGPGGSAGDATSTRNR